GNGKPVKPSGAYCVSPPASQRCKAPAPPAGRRLRFGLGAVHSSVRTPCELLQASVRAGDVKARETFDDSARLAPRPQRQVDHGEAVVPDVKVLLDYATAPERRQRQFRIAKNVGQDHQESLKSLRRRAVGRNRPQPLWRVIGTREAYSFGIPLL